MRALYSRVRLPKLQGSGTRHTHDHEPQPSQQLAALPHPPAALTREAPVAVPRLRLLPILVNIQQQSIVLLVLPPSARHLCGREEQAS